ncbi:CDP-diacylglycerol--serine O-phosphatidyltransferase [Roseobacter sp.]|uniref:CDP-diacylglycerol--serine O-phosphatidyltransferase n=1 Tax=Roseobacter sp. TaxID=1907202 RepID=UPI00385BB848
MSHGAPERETKVRVLSLLPNLLTIAAICAGLTAIRFGYEGNFDMAVGLILAACILDGMDGRLARMTNSATPIGAELDSLADFLNFGIAPVLILHNWALQDFRNEGWIAVLCYAICSVLRLARFNVSNRSEKVGGASDFFVGVPSPAGALLVMLPLVFSLAFADLPIAPPAAVAAYICMVGLLMISRVPTYSFKNLTIDRGNTKFFMLGAGILIAALLMYPWATLVLLTLAYIGSFFWALRSTRNPR